MGEVGLGTKIPRIEKIVKAGLKSKVLMVLKPDTRSCSPDTHNCSQLCLLPRLHLSIDPKRSRRRNMNACIPKNLAYHYHDKRLTTFAMTLRGRLGAGFAHDQIRGKYFADLITLFTRHYFIKDFGRLFSHGEQRLLDRSQTNWTE